MWYVIITFFITLSGFIAQASEEVPQSMTLDGRLFSDSLATIPLTDIVSMKIQILNASQTCILYEETQSINTTATSGYYTIQVGQKMSPPAGKRTSGDSNNNLANIFSNSITTIPGKLASDETTLCNYLPAAGDTRYLKFVMTPATDNIPRMTTTNLRLDSVPMALVAERAENLRGFTPSQFLQVNGTTASLTQANLENILSTTNYTNLNSILATPAANYVSKNANGSVLIPSVPGAPGSGLSAGQIWYDSTNNLLKYRDNAGTQTIGKATGAAGFLNGGNAFGSSGILGTTDATSLIFLTNGSSRMIIDSAGNVGIGTSSPTASLNVYDTGVSSTLKLQASGGNNIIQDWQIGNSFGANSYRVQTNVGAVGAMEFAYGGSLTKMFTLDGPNNKTYFPNGNVGFGTTSPQTIAHISRPDTSIYYAGNFGATTPWASTGPVLTLENTSSSNYSGAAVNFQVKNANSAVAKGYIAASSVYDNIASVMIGGQTSSNTYHEYAKFDKTSLALGTENTAGTFAIYGSGVPSNALTINATSHATPGPLLLNSTGGNVGIGTTTPSAKLTIAGTANSVPNIIASGGNVDLSLSNVHLLQSVGGSIINLSNISNGASYTLIISDTTQQTYTFTGCTNSYFSPANGQTFQQSTYSILVVVVGANTNCYINWVTGFN